MTPRNQIIIDNRWMEGDVKKYRSNQEQLQQNEREKEVQRQRDERAQSEARNDSQRGVAQGQSNLHEHTFAPHIGSPEPPDAVTLAELAGST